MSIFSKHLSTNKEINQSPRLVCIYLCMYINIYNLLIIFFLQEESKLNLFNPNVTNRGEQNHERTSTCTCSARPTCSTCRVSQQQKQTQTLPLQCNDPSSPPHLPKVSWAYLSTANSPSRPASGPGRAGPGRGARQALTCEVPNLGLFRGRKRGRKKLIGDQQMLRRYQRILHTHISRPLA